MVQIFIWTLKLAGAYILLLHISYFTSKLLIDYQM